MMKIAIIGAIALTASFVDARSSHHVSQNAFTDLYFDCIGCFQKSNWYCAKQDSPNYGKCSDKAFSDCAGFTWEGTLDNSGKCMSLFNTYSVQAECPDYRGTSYTHRNGKKISWNSKMLTVHNPYAGFFNHITIHNEEMFDNLAVQVPNNAAVYIMGRTFNTFTKVSGTTVTI